MVDSLPVRLQNFSMAPTIQPTKSRIALQTNDHHVQLPERFVIRMLGAKEQSIDGTGIKLVGRRLIARVAETMSAGELVRIDVQDAFLLGEVLGCWREGSAVFAAIELQQALTRLSELATHFGTRNPAELRRSA